MTHLAENMMDGLIPFFEVFVLCLNILSIIVLIWGVALAAADFFKSEFQKQDRLMITTNNNLIKNFLGSYILLSLEILIAADIIESIIKPTFQDLFKLASLVVIRTVISYFLHKEIEDAIKDDQIKKDETG
ncbi:DUF1622 domain-containing protein [Enterococcus sp. BWT-B8]|uniref:DUF1622 domain-containing protein n=1 Tax=unclassified Enterococcus TaxID=2608891 RepID=UPI001E5ADD87|nr:MULTISPECIES: DUF1622 domain-containing protein [unclassified Enterococcus]MCB5951397.1 DUF1622 domain-containing protein [Enterococcus sp. BWT-B8]MCB5954956.1 DUF1622 domain-containing protein [Enterococcus sp. CWB-B31]